MTLRIWEPDIAPSGAGKYHGAIATGYDAKREQSPKWQVEQRIIQDMLMDLQPGSIVLDVPIGTGRFIPFYAERGLECWGADLSIDMLDLAGQKHRDQAPHGKLRLGRADVRKLPLPNKSVDAACMIRLTRWLSPEDCQKAIRELQRVARKRIIFTARVSDHPHARPLSLFQEALDGWHVARNEAGHEPAYRIVELGPHA